MVAIIFLIFGLGISYLVINEATLAQSAATPKTPSTSAVNQPQTTPIMSNLPIDAKQLPAGYYVYYGPNPRKPAPRRFSIAANSTVLWQDTIPVATATPTNEQKLESHTNLENKIYPLIKWKPRPVAGMPGVFAQLTLTHAKELEAFNTAKLVLATSGPVKYKCILINAKRPMNIEITMRDANDFKNSSFLIPHTKFEPKEGTQLVTGKIKVSHFGRNGSRKCCHLNTGIFNL